MQAPRATDPADDTLQNDGADAVDSTRKSGKQRDNQGHREGATLFSSPHTTPQFCSDFTCAAELRGDERC